MHFHGDGDARRLRWALAITFAFLIAEVVGGILSNSLALLADAGHMLTDVAALALSTNRCCPSRSSTNSWLIPCCSK